MNIINRHLWAGAAAIVLAVSLAAMAQLDKKPYTEWTEKEAEKLLDKSPWAQTQVSTSTAGTFSTGPGTTATSGGPPAGGIDQISYHIRFLSAKPVRQAISRIMELRQKGAMNDQLAAQLKAFANQEFPDYVVVTVTVEGSESKGRLQSATAMLNSRTTATLKNNTYLIVKDQRIFLEEYQPPRPDGLGARFIFPRIVDGKPIITPENDEVRFISELTRAFKLNMRYKVSDMMFGGKLEY